MGDVNACYATHTSKRRLAALDRFIQGIGANYYVSRHPTHISRSHNTVSWLDAVIATPGVEIQSLFPLTHDILPVNPSSHFPLMIKVKLKGEKQIPQKPSRYSGPFIYHKKTNWDNVSLPLFHKISSNLQKLNDYVLSGMSWEIQTKFFCDSIAYAIDKATLKPEEKEETIFKLKIHSFRHALVQFRKTRAISDI